MMKKVRIARLGLHLMILAVASCGFYYPGVHGEGNGSDGSSDGMGATNGSSDGMGAADNVYVADLVTHIIRKVTTAGVVTTLAGTARMSGSADGTGADARFFNPAGVAVDSAGNVYVADLGNQVIRKITPAGVVT